MQDKHRKVMPTQYTYTTFLYWLLLAGLIVFFLFLSWDLHLFHTIFAQDITRISSLIFILFIAVSVHCGYRSWFIASQSLMLFKIKKLSLDDLRLLSEDSLEGRSVIKGFLGKVLNSHSEPDKTLATEVLAESLRGTHQVGWFMAGVVIKLGLLGTVVGFVLMLSSISAFEQLDISDIKELMQQMTQGMGVAMNTTMVGLIASMSLGIQLLLVDRCADRLLLEAIDFSLSTADLLVDDRGEGGVPLSAQK